MTSSTLLLGGVGLPIHPAQADPSFISQNLQGWDTAVQMARLVNDNQELTALLVQLNVLNKPTTSYANVVYQLFAKKDDRWIQVYNTTGARLIPGDAGNVLLPAEVIQISEIRKVLGNDVDLSTLEWKAVSLLRYDIPGGLRDQTLQFDQSQAFSNLWQVSSNQLVQNRFITTSSSSTTNNSPRYPTYPTTAAYPNPNCSLKYTPNGTLAVHRGEFSLAIVQPRGNLSDVIARVSLMAKRGEDSYLKEQLVGDFRYKVNQRANFIRGLNTGDRVVVRLFTLQNQLIGYSEFETLQDQTATTLVLSEDPVRNPVVRTISGYNLAQNGTIEQERGFYDYFTQINPGDSFETSVATFLGNNQNLNLNAFQLAGFPRPSAQPTYSCSFRDGRFYLVNRSFSVYDSSLAPGLTALPGKLTQIIYLSNTETSSYEVARQILSYKELGMTEGSVTNIDNDRASVDRSRRRCNQGIGNGAEGCDPGNSRPHGGSNDEAGRTPGNK